MENEQSAVCKQSKHTAWKLGHININSIRGKKLELLAFLDLHQPQIVAIQDTKIDRTISTSELFPETCPYILYKYIIYI